VSIEQKRAWFVVVVFALAVICFLLLVALMGWKFAPGGIAVFGLAGLANLFFPNKVAPGVVTKDERDRMIAEKAALEGGHASFLLVGLACMVPWFVYMFRDQEVISIHVLPVIFMGSMVVLEGIKALVLLILYGREEKENIDRA
jgi:hypothetical protein